MGLGFLLEETERVPLMVIWWYVLEMSRVAVVSDPGLESRSKRQVRSELQMQSWE
jgi:hypothetical protein